MNRHAQTRQHTKLGHDVCRTFAQRIGLNHSVSEGIEKTSDSSQVRLPFMLPQGLQVLSRKAHTMAPRPMLTSYHILTGATIEDMSQRA